jgi:hypothetical protein
VRKVIISREQWDLLRKDARFHFHASDAMIRAVIFDVLKLKVSAGSWSFVVK